MKIAIAFVVVAMGTCAPLTIAAAGSKCEIMASGGFTVVVVCPKGLSDRDLSNAGLLACSRSGPCNAWIWDDAKKAPAAPPSFTNPMTDAQADSSVAVWINNVHELQKR